MRNDAIAEAQAVFDHPLTPPTDPDTNADPNPLNSKAEATAIIGDKTYDADNDGTLDTTNDRYKGLAQVAYEEVAGNKDLIIADPDNAGETIPDVNNDDYKGSAQVAYDAAIALEKGLRDATVGTHGGDVDREDNDTPKISGTLDNNPGSFVDYRAEVGTAITDLELVVGHGTQLSTVTEISGDDADQYAENFYGTALINYDADTTVVVVGGDDIDVELPMRIVSMDTSGMEPFGILSNGLLECATSDCTSVDGAMWVKFTEDGINNNLFTNSPDDDANLKTTINAQRGLSFELEYDNGVEGGIGFSTTTISIDAGDDWGSGEEISVTLTDPDANTNSLTEDDLSVRNPDQTIRP